jgi:hypothetical protein
MKEWQSSSMALAWKNPVFQAFLEDAKKDLGPEVQTDCVACHAPLGFVTGDLKMEDPKSQEGVTCNFCHNVSDVEVSPRPASYTHDPSDPLLMRGPFKDADPAAAHGSQYRELFTKSDFCASCHWYDREPGVTIEATHPQWKASKAAASGAQCQSCHMKPYSGKACAHRPEDARSGLVARVPGRALRLAPGLGRDARRRRGGRTPQAHGHEPPGGPFAPGRRGFLPLDRPRRRVS